jgi:periplasmic protein TonB
MPTLQLRLNEYKRAPESGGAPPQNTSHEPTETTHRDTIELKASGMVLPIPFSRKNGNGITLALPPTVKKDVFLNALLETPTAKQPRRSPLEWAGAMSLHLVILAALIIIPLYTTGTIHLPDYDAVPLIAPPPPPPPAPPAAATAPRVVRRPRTELTYKLHRLTAPTAIPKKVSLGDPSSPPPDVGGIAGGVPGGIVGGEIGGIVGGVLGGTGSSVPTPVPAQKPAPKLVRVGSKLKAPRQTYSVDPEYPTLAKQAHIRGTVLVDAIIDEHGNVVQAHAISGHPLLIAAALKAVLQWRYEPTSLNGQPISVELEVSVTFR